MKFEDSAVYKQGLVHRRLGELMTNPKTTIRDLADAKYELGLDLEISLRAAVFDEIERAAEQAAEKEDGHV